MFTVWIILSVIASLFSLFDKVNPLTLAIEDNSFCLSLKNFSILSLSLIILSVVYLVAELSLFSVKAEEAEFYLDGLFFSETSYSLLKLLFYFSYVSISLCLV